MHEVHRVQIMAAIKKTRSGSKITGLYCRRVNAKLGLHWSRRTAFCASEHAWRGRSALTAVHGI